MNKVEKVSRAMVRMIIRNTPQMVLEAEKQNLEDQMWLYYQQLAEAAIEAVELYVDDSEVTDA